MQKSTIHNFFKFTLIIIFILLILSCKKPLREDTFIVFGTSCSIKSHSLSHKKYFEYLRDIENKISYRIESSQVSQFNRSEITFEDFDEDVKELLTLSFKFKKESEGCFDPEILSLVKLWGWDDYDVKIPTENEIKKALADKSQIDLGGVAKGWAADKLKNMMIKDGIKEGIINLGGNILVFGEKDYNIGLQIPFEERGRYDIVKTVKNKSIVTSGSYEKFKIIDDKLYHHIINPFTGHPAESKHKSVTVITSSSAVADAFATAIFVGGDKIKEIFLTLYPDSEVIYQ